jgi:A/G-specific adenine glycosylase
MRGKKLSAQEIRGFRKTIYAYYHAHGRSHLSWRKTTNPYRILVSEIMLQQTQVERVEKKYREFLKTFPTLKSLAHAPLADVLRAWQGLGYNRRAKMLHRAAQEVVKHHGGRMPHDFDALTKLSGIGPSTAGGVCAYAYNMPVVFIETNIRRVFIHHFFRDIEGVGDTDIKPLVEITLDQNNPREWYSALMDYGTFLAETIPNPNRKSTHYTKQSRFIGSKREVRGGILRALTEKSLTEQGLCSLPFEKERIVDILKDLSAEHLIHRKGRRYYLGEKE